MFFEKQKTASSFAFGAVAFADTIKAPSGPSS
jgi:hypothetical protein